MCCAGVDLVRRLSLGWARGLGFTEGSGQPWCLGPALVCAFKVERTINCGARQPLYPKKFPAAPLLFGRVLGLVPLYCNCFFKVRVLFLFLFSVPQHRQICSWSLRTIPPHCRVSGGVLSIGFCVSVFRVLCVVSLCLLCRSSSVSPYFFRRNGSINRCRFGFWRM